MKKAIFVTFGVVSLLSCSPRAVPPASGSDGERLLTLREINMNIGRYIGEKVTFSAYFSNRHEDYSLYSNSDMELTDRQDICLHIGNEEDVSDEFRIHSGDKAIFVGLLEVNPCSTEYICISTCNGYQITIDDIVPVQNR